MSDREYVERITQKLLDDGRIIEAGWTVFRFAAIPLSAPAAQVDAMRSSYFAGAQHLFSTIMEALDPEPDASEEHRVNLLHMELKRFVREYELKYCPPHGSA